MELDSDIPTTPETEEALQSGVTSMGVPKATVVIAQNFAKEISRLTLTPGYSVDRTDGYVAGKTIQLSGGDIIIVINARAIEELNTGMVQRLAAHEAGHVLIYQHHEDVTWKDTAELCTIGWQRVTMYVASKALDEFRVELALMRLGYPVAPDADPEIFALSLMSANIGALEAVFRYRQNGDVIAMQDTTLVVLDRLSKQLAYLIACQPFSPLDVASFDLTAQSNWDALIAPVWEKHLAHYGAIPDACTRIDREQTKSIAERGGYAAIALLGSLGFEFTGDSANTSFWCRQNDDELERAFARYHADESIRGRMNM